MAHRRLDRNRVGEWVTRLLKPKGSDAQRELLRHALDDSPAEFADFVEAGIAGASGRGAYRGDGAVPSLLGPDGKCVVTLTPGHMYLMPHKDIVALHRHWRDIPVEDASDSSLWGAITLAEIRAGRISPAWLAVDRNGDVERARGELDRAIRGSDIRQTDRMVRRVLRWMMAPGHMRGAAELYGNCSLAKAWWCGHLASRCAEDLAGGGDAIDPDTATLALKGIWLEMADYFAGKLTVIAEQNVLSGIALWAGRHVGAPGSEDACPPPRPEVRRVMLGLGEISSWCVLGVRPPGQILETIDGLPSPAAEAAAPG